jgi:hypothetical protein
MSSLIKPQLSSQPTAGSVSESDARRVAPRFVAVTCAKSAATFFARFISR